jgi:MmyB-like transcription regulator ligand binding domain
VRLHRTGVKRLRHPVVGELTLSFETTPLPADPGLALTMLRAPGGSPGGRLAVNVPCDTVNKNDV